MGNKDIQPTKEAINSMYSKASSVTTNISSNTVFSLTWHFRSIFQGLSKSLMHWASIAFVSAKIKKTLQKSPDGFFITTLIMEGTLSNICVFAQLVEENIQARTAFLYVKDFTFKSDFWSRDMHILIKREISEWREKEEYKGECDSSGKEPPKIDATSWEVTKPKKSFLILCSQWDFYQNDVVMDCYKPIEIVMKDLYFGPASEILENISSTTDQMLKDLTEMKKKQDAQDKKLEAQAKLLEAQDKKLDAQAKLLNAQAKLLEDQSQKIDFLIVCLLTLN